MIRQPHILWCPTVICSKVNLTCIQFLSSVYFWIVLKINFWNSPPIVDRGLSDVHFVEIVGLCRVSAELWFLLPSKVPWNDQTEGSNWINMLNAQKVFKGDTGEIRSICHQNHRRFLISRKLTGIASWTVASRASNPSNYKGWQSPLLLYPNRRPQRELRFRQFLYIARVRALLRDGSGIISCLHSLCLARVVSLAPLF